MNIDNIYEIMNAIDDNASLNRTSTKKQMSENRHKQKVPHKTINEYYDEEAPLGRYGRPSQAVTWGDPVPKWFMDKYGYRDEESARAAWNRARKESREMNNNRNPWESVSSNKKHMLKEDEATDQSTQDQKQNVSSDGAAVTKQLQDSDYEQFVNILNSDGKSQAFVNYLKAHYKMGDNTLGTIKKCNPSEGVTLCGKLIPTQENISLKKSFSFLSEPGWSEKVINDPTNAFDTPTITYAGKYIIDGHHRWSRIYAVHGPKGQLKVLNFPQIPGVSWEDMLKAVQLAIRVNAANLDLRNAVDNPNMLQDSTGKQAGAEYIKVACDAVVAAMKAKGYGDTKEAQAVRVASNAAAMAKGGAVPGAEPREIMPQTDKVDKTGAAVEKTLKTQGVIDMTENLDDNIEEGYIGYYAYDGSEKKAPQWWLDKGGTDASWREQQRINNSGKYDEERGEYMWGSQRVRENVNVEEDLANEGYIAYYGYDGAEKKAPQWWLDKGGTNASWVAQIKKDKEEQDELDRRNRP